MNFGKFSTVLQLRDNSVRTERKFRKFTQVICKNPQLKDRSGKIDRSVVILAANCVTVSIPAHGVP